jgi:hypothetical protein
MGARPDPADEESADARQRIHPFADDGSGMFCLCNLPSGHPHHQDVAHAS